MVGGVFLWLLHKLSHVFPKLLFLFVSFVIERNDCLIVTLELHLTGMLMFGC